MIPYIINAGLILAGCLAFYKLLLQKETFYRLNRWVLIACLLTAFSLPLIPVPQQFSLRKTSDITVVDNQTVNGTDPKTIDNSTSPSPSPIKSLTEENKSNSIISETISFQKLLTYLIYLYWFGVIAFSLSFLMQVIILLVRAYKNPVIIDGQFRIVEIKGNKAPCSFANNIFINPEKYDWDTYNQILLHEKVHIQQRHTIDILLAEMVLIFQWFNPFAWIYRKEVESNLEFLTDDHLVNHKEVERSTYQLSLLKVSSPDFPMRVATNYNQSLLKKRIVMMNAKRSNLHTAWKYFFLLPVLVFFACLLNQPVAKAQATKEKEEKKETGRKSGGGIETEGSWFATIKDDKISFQFKRDDDEHSSFNTSSFELKEFTNLPRGTAGTFKLTREAGTIEFNGKFEGDQGMGKYKFIPDNAYGTDMGSQLNEKLNDRDLMVFFFIDIKKSYVQMLKNQGYSDIDKDEIIPLAALNVSESYIKSLKESGFKNLSLKDLIPFKSLGIDGTYIKEIRENYPNISAHQLISFKAQNIDKNYIEKVKKAEAKGEKGENGDSENPDDLVAFKALDVDDEYISSFKTVGLTNISRRDIIPMKSLGITADFVKGFQSIGYSDLRPHDLIPLKAQHITPEFIKGFEALGYKSIPIDQVISLKAMEVTPAYIKSMKEKGFNYNRLDKYIQLKSIDN